jgi:hypothetical protein
MRDEDGFWNKFWDKAAEQMSCSSCPFVDECKPHDGEKDGKSCGQVLANIFLTHYTEGNYEW